LFFKLEDIHTVNLSKPLKSIKHKFFDDIGCTNYLPVYPLKKLYKAADITSFDQILFSLILWRSRNKHKCSFYEQSASTFSGILKIDVATVTRSLQRLKHVGLLRMAEKPENASAFFKRHFYIPKCIETDGNPFLIPLEVLKDKNLTWDQKLIYGEVCYKFAIQERHGFGKFKTMEGFVPLGKKRLKARISRSENYFWKRCKELEEMGLVRIEKRIIDKTLVWFYSLNKLADSYGKKESFQEIEQVISESIKSKRAKKYKRSVKKVHEGSFGQETEKIKEMDRELCLLCDMEEQEKEEVPSSYSSYSINNIISEENFSLLEKELDNEINLASVDCGSYLEEEDILSEKVPCVSLRELAGAEDILSEKIDPLHCILKESFSVLNKEVVMDLAPSVLDRNVFGENSVGKCLRGSGTNPPTPFPIGACFYSNRKRARLEAREALKLTRYSQSIGRIRNVSVGKAKSILWAWFKTEIERKAIVGERFHEDALGIEQAEAKKKLMRKYKKRYAQMIEIGAKEILQSGKTPYFSTLGMIVHTNKGDFIMSSDWRANKELNEAKRIKNKEERKEKTKSAVEKALSKMQVAADVKMLGNGFFISTVEEFPEVKSNRLDIFAKEMKKSKFKDKTKNHKIDNESRQEGESHNEWLLRISKRKAIVAYEKFFLEGGPSNVDKSDLAVLDNALSQLIQEKTLKDPESVALYIERASCESDFREKVGLWQLNRCKKQDFRIRQIFGNYNIGCFVKYIRDYLDWDISDSSKKSAVQMDRENLKVFHDDSQEVMDELNRSYFERLKRLKEDMLARDQQNQNA